MKKILILFLSIVLVSCHDICHDTGQKINIYEDIVNTCWKNKSVTIDFVTDDEALFITALDTFKCNYIYTQNYVYFFYRKQISTLFNSYINYAKLVDSTMTLHLLMPTANRWTIDLKIK